MADTTLVEDLVCSSSTSPAIIIGAPNITLDLGGHVISGPGYSFSDGVLAESIEGIAIRNGTIEGNAIGINLINTRDVTIENLTIRNSTVIDPDHFITGMTIIGSQDVVVREILFEFPSVHHKEAVIIDNSDVAVSNIEMTGGSVGVNFGGACGQEDTRSSGMVLNSRFSGLTIAGILVQCSNSAQIADNVFTQSEGGITSDPSFYGAVSGLEVEGNNFSDLYIGIHFIGVIESRISNNIISGTIASGYHTYMGIAIMPSMGCYAGSPDFECFYSTGSVIVDNETRGYDIDLYHHEDSVGNVWERNTCGGKEGIEIPECTPLNQ